MVSLAFTLLHNLIRHLLYKVRYQGRYTSAVVERISLNTTIRLFGKGCINLGRNIELAAFVDVKVLGHGSLTIGNNVYMNKFCMISCQERISIGHNCMFGPGVKIFDNNHRFSKDKGVSSELSKGNISIGANCWIASNAVILKGAQIGDNCIIGAGCIINSAIPDNSIVRLRQTQEIEQLR